jgi:uncharacterized protein (TIRG00374 family)
VLDLRAGAVTAKRRRLLLAASLFVGLAGFVAIPLVVGVEETLAVIGEVGVWGIAVYTAAASLTIVFPAVSWCILLRGAGVRCPLGLAIRTNLMGWPINFLTPSMYLGSEPLRVLYLADRLGVPRRTVVATVIVSKFQEFAALVLMTAVAVWLLTWKREVLAARMEHVLVAATVILAAGLALLLWAILGRWNLSVGVLRLLARLGVLRRRIGPWIEKAREVEAFVREAFTERIGRFFVAQIFAFLSAVSIFVRPWVFHVWTAGRGRLPLHHIAAVYVLTNLVNTVQFIPGSLGLLEGGVAAYFAQAADPAMPQASAAAFLVVNRIADLALLSLGLTLLVRAGLRRWLRAEDLRREGMDLAAPPPGRARS